MHDTASMLAAPARFAKVITLLLLVPCLRSRRQPLNTATACRRFHVPAKYDSEEADASRADLSRGISDVEQMVKFCSFSETGDAELIARVARTVPSARIRG